MELYCPLCAGVISKQSSVGESILCEHCRKRVMPDPREISPPSICSSQSSPDISGPEGHDAHVPTAVRISGLIALLTIPFSIVAFPGSQPKDEMAKAFFTFLFLANFFASVTFAVSGIQYRPICSWLGPTSIVCAFLLVFLTRSADDGSPLLGVFFGVGPIVVFSVFAYVLFVLIPE
jgi:hypothetical protein